MRIFNEKLPNAGDLVAVKIIKVNDCNSLVQLLEYGNIEGMIVSTEVSRKKCFNIKKLMKIGCIEIMQVMRIETKGDQVFVDLTKKNLDLKDCEQRKSFFYKSKKLYEIIQNISLKYNIDIDLLLKQWLWDLFEKTEDLILSKNINNTEDNNIEDNDIEDNNIKSDVIKCNDIEENNGENNIQENFIEENKDIQNNIFINRNKKERNSRKRKRENFQKNIEKYNEDPEEEPQLFNNHPLDNFIYFLNEYEKLNNGDKIIDYLRTEYNNKVKSKDINFDLKFKLNCYKNGGIKNIKNVLIKLNDIYTELNITLIKSPIYNARFVISNQKDGDKKANDIKKQLETLCLEENTIVKFI